MSGTLTNSGQQGNKDTPPEDHIQDKAAIQEIKQDADAPDHAEDGSAGLAPEATHEPGLASTAPVEQQRGAADAAGADGDIPATAATPAASPPVEAAGQASRLPLPQKRQPAKGQAAVLLLLLSLSLAGTLISGGYAFSYGMSAYATYTSLRGRANAGVQHLLDVKTIFSGASAHPTGFLDANKLQRAQKEFGAARQNFQQVEYTLDHAAIIATIHQDLPQLHPQLNALQAVSRIGVDAAEIGQELISTASVLAPTFRGSLLNNTPAPLVTQTTLDLLGTTIDRLLPRVQDMQVQSRTFSVNQLPGVSQHERDQLTQLLQALPQAEVDLTQARGLLSAAGWILGVNQPRTFLVQTMDRAELRPTGGFTGQYGLLSINGGRVAPFTLKDISLVEYTATSTTLGKQAPSQYHSWWPFANWGLRDSNLSADFPTSAQIAISQYKSEVGHQVDGVILLTPFLIEHILQVIGPVKVAGYNDTITAQNLEERLHYYQQDNAGLAKQVVYQPGDTSTSSRKRFTSLLAHLLMDHVRHAPPDEIISIARQMLTDLKTRDLQIYVANPQIEGLLSQYGDAARMDRSTTHDGLYVVQANISASKASQYVRTSMHDTVALDNQGGAKHVLQLRFVYNQVGPVYGYDTYHDYVRVYVPVASTYLWGDGFDTGIPLCGATYVACPQRDVYPKDELLCPAGQFQPGARAPSLANEDGGVWHPLDTVGPPTNLVSDEPGRAMFGGWVIIPKNCTMTVTLSWYVPGQKPGAPYTLLVQRQAGSFPELDLTLLPSPGNCVAMHSAGQHFDGLLLEDAAFSIKALAAQQSAGCYPQPGV